MNVKRRTRLNPLWTKRDVVDRIKTVDLRDYVVSTRTVSSWTINVFDVAAVVAAMERGSGICYIPPGYWQPNAFNVPLDDTLLSDITTKDNFVYIFRGAGRQSYIIGADGMVTGDYVFKANSTDDANSYQSHPKIVCEDFTFRGYYGAAGSQQASFMRAYQRSVHARRVNLAGYHEGFRLTGYADSCRFEHINSTWGQTPTGWMIISDDRGDGHVYDNIFAYACNAVSLRGQAGASFRGCVGGRWAVTYSDVTFRDCHIEAFPPAESEDTKYLPVLTIQKSNVTLESGSYFPVAYRKFIQIDDGGAWSNHTTLIINDAVRWIQRLDAPGSADGSVRGSCIDIVKLGRTGRIVNHRSAMWFYSNLTGQAGEAPIRLSGPYITVSGGDAEFTALATQLGYSNILAGVAGDFEIRWEAGEWLPRPISPVRLRTPQGGVTLTAAAYNGTYGVAWGSDMVTGTTYFYKAWTLDSAGLRSASVAEVSAATDGSNNTIKLEFDTRFAPCSLRVVRGTSTGVYTKYVTIPLAVSASHLVDQGSSINGYAWGDVSGSVAVPPASSEMMTGLFYPSLFLKHTWSAAGAAAPSAGTHNRGDICWDIQPTIGEPAGWACTTSGSPGTWTPFGQVGGPLVQSLTGSATLAAKGACEYIYLLGTGAAPTLPTANGCRYTLKNTTTGTVTIATTSSQKIDGSTTYVLAAKESITVASDGSDWSVI